MADVSPSVAACMSDMAAEILALRARLAEVEALCDREEEHVAREIPRPDALVSTEQVRAAARGEGDRG